MTIDLPTPIIPSVTPRLRLCFIALTVLEGKKRSEWFFIAVFLQTAPDSSKLKELMWSVCFAPPVIAHNHSFIDLFIFCPISSLSVQRRNKAGNIFASFCWAFSAAASSAEAGKCWFSSSFSRILWLRCVVIELIFFYNFHQNAGTHFVSVFLFFNFFSPLIRVKDGLVPLCHCSKIISIIRTGMMKPKNQMRHNKFCFHLGCITAVFFFFSRFLSSSGANNKQSN